MIDLVALSRKIPLDVALRKLDEIPGRDPRVNSVQPQLPRERGIC